MTRRTEEGWELQKIIRRDVERCGDYYEMICEAKET
jgi:hypothetical protein